MTDNTTYKLEVTYGFNGAGQVVMQFSVPGMAVPAQIIFNADQAVQHIHAVTGTLLAAISQAQKQQQQQADNRSQDQVVQDRILQEANFGGKFNA